MPSATYNLCAVRVIQGKKQMLLTLFSTSMNRKISCKYNISDFTFYGMRKERIDQLLKFIERQCKTEDIDVEDIVLYEKKTEIKDWLGLAAVIGLFILYSAI